MQEEKNLHNAVRRRYTINNGSSGRSNKHDKNARKFREEQINNKYKKRPKY